LGMLLLTQLKPILESPIMAPAFKNILPALFGGLLVVFVAKNPKIAAVPFAFMLILFIWFAAFAWNYRIGETSLFKMSWILAFPFFSVLAHILYRALMWLFKIINYVFIGIAGTYCLPLGALVYAVILMIVSLVFLARSDG